VDQIEVECKEFEESNRAVFEQVTTDLEHIASKMANQDRVKAEAIAGQEEMRTRTREVEGDLHKLQREYMTIRERNAEELSLREDDQDVFTAILELSTCPAGADDYSFSQWKVCNAGNGNTEVVSANRTVQERLARSPRAQRALLAVFGGRGGEAPGGGMPEAVSLLQAGSQEAQGQPQGTDRSCRSSGPVNCGYLHDTMATQWGKFKDLVDEMTSLMEHNHDEWIRQRDNMNDQIGTLREHSSQFAEMLTEATSELNSLRSSSRQKEEQHRDLSHAFDMKMASCKERISEILFTDICAVRTVRNALLQYSTNMKPHQVSDCTVTDWSPGPCTTDGMQRSAKVDCDDACPLDVGGIDVDKCGGIKHLTRQVIVSPNGLGMSCPPLFFERKNGSAGMKCSQFHCPVACVLSEWSSWAACSKECGGGTRGKTRSVLTPSRNGGMECGVTIEEQACNTGSCRRDCTLAPWTDWEPCTQACGGGMTKRVRHVDVPIRADGRCPSPEHPDRLQWQRCNTQDCVGDEICIARQDLIIAVDASGSLKEEGFSIVREFAYNLTGRYRSEYYGVEDMYIGLVLFGNGEYYSNGTVSAAIEVLELTDDLDAVRTSIQSMTWQKGFTNMMQAFQAADNLLQDGREDAQSAIMVISDGKWTNAYRTGLKAQELKDKGVQIYMLPIVSPIHDQLEELKKWASPPWETNYVQLPGTEYVSGNEEEFAQRVIVKFCPRAFSPSLEMENDEQVGFLKIHENGYPADSCGAWKYLGNAASAEACKDMVLEAYSDGSVLAFAYESGGYWAGTCYSEAIEVTDALWASALSDRVSIDCGGVADAWVYNYYASTYIMNPSMFGDVFDYS